MTTTPAYNDPTWHQIANCDHAAFDQADTPQRPARSCSHPHCRTSLNDETAVYCDHGLPFCEHCTWEEACADCATDARIAELRAWTVPAVTVVTRELEPPCRCGWADVSPHGTPPVRVPVLDLTGQPGRVALETTPIRGACRACTHPILPGKACVLHHLRPGTSAVFNRYHPECVEYS